MRQGAVAAIFSILLSLMPASAGELPRIVSAKNRYRIGEEVVVRLVNRSSKPVDFRNPMRITDRFTLEEVARIRSEEPGTTIAPGGKRTFIWDQTHEGAQVDAGRFTAVVHTSEGGVGTRFSIGRYFTLGFDGRPNTSFVVYVITQPEVDQMTEEASREEKNLIVSGVVQLRELRYNPDWSYVMDPRSIVLGEVFTEVCDAAPQYVENHKRQWKGERWCPWSSYVERVGRSR